MAGRGQVAVGPKITLAVVAVVAIIWPPKVRKYAKVVKKSLNYAGRSGRGQICIKITVKTVWGLTDFYYKHGFNPTHRKMNAKKFRIM